MGINVGYSVDEDGIEDNCWVLGRKDKDGSNDNDGLRLGTGSNGMEN